MEFVESLTVTARTQEDSQAAVEIALPTWNSSFLPADEHSASLRQSIPSLSGGKDALPFEAEPCIRMLPARLCHRNYGPLGGKGSVLSSMVSRNANSMIWSSELLKRSGSVPPPVRCRTSDSTVIRFSAAPLCI